MTGMFHTRTYECNGKERKDDYQTTEMAVQAGDVVKTLLTLIAVLALTASMGVLALSASAETGWYKLILVTPTDHFEPQIGTYLTLRECTTEGARRLHDQDLYAGFGCVYWTG